METMLEMGSHCTRHRREGKSLRGDSWGNRSQNPEQKEGRAGSPGGASESPEISHTPAEGLAQNGTALILTCEGPPGVSADTGSSESTWRAAKGRPESGRPGPRTPRGSRVADGKGTSLCGAQEAAQGREGWARRWDQQRGAVHPGRATEPKRRGSSDQVGRRQDSFVEGGSQSAWAAVMVTAVPHSPHTCGQRPPAPLIHPPQSDTACVPSFSSAHYAQQKPGFLPSLPCASGHRPPSLADFLSPVRPLTAPALLRGSPERLPCLLSSPSPIQSHTAARASSLPKEHI